MSTRGKLRVDLGAAPGVGKTYHMLDEAPRRAERGGDVVVGLVGVAEVVDFALDSLAADSRHVVLGGFDGFDGVPEILADPVLMERVIANLVGNALTHGGTATPVLLTASALGDQVQLRVIDRGPGIPPADIERVFAPFQRLGDRDNTTGVGLGLALSRGLVEAMGGTLTPEETPGGGLTMVIAIPAADAVAEQADAARSDTADATEASA